MLNEDIQIDARWSYSSIPSEKRNRAVYSVVSSHIKHANKPNNYSLSVGQYNCVYNLVTMVTSAGE